MPEEEMEDEEEEVDRPGCGRSEGEIPEGMEVGSCGLPVVRERRVRGDDGEGERKDVPEAARMV